MNIYKSLGKIKKKLPHKAKKLIILRKKFSSPAYKKNNTRTQDFVNILIKH